MIKRKSNREKFREEIIREFKIMIIYLLNNVLLIMKKALIVRLGLYSGIQVSLSFNHLATKQ